MFRVGQRVWHRDSQRSGTVLECDGDRVFIVQANGVELDFLASDLTTTPPAGSNVSGVNQGIAGRQPGRRPTWCRAGP
jgi:hypothetical protein